jgi:hypothetical protein
MVLSLYNPGWIWPPRLEYASSKEGDAFFEFNEVGIGWRVYLNACEEMHILIDG